MGTLKASLKDEMTSPVVETANAGAEASCCTHRSIETLVVVLAVITIVGVIAGIIAKLCGGRHFGSNGENDIEGWVEKKCRSCLDGGISAATPPPTPPPPPPPPPEEPKPTAEETKK